MTRIRPQCHDVTSRGQQDARQATQVTFAATISKLGSNYWLLLDLPHIIGYYWLLLAINGVYWLLFAIIFFAKVFILLAIIVTGSIINYCNYWYTIIAIIGSANNYWHYWLL
jgi:hypothetical protein